MRQYLLTPVIFFSSLFVFVISASLFAQDGNNQPPPPCSLPEARQFDFWLGEWELTWPGGQGGIPEDQQGKASNVIEKLFGDCVIQENFSTAGAAYLGKSWSVYNTQAKQWQQTWVDNNGGYLLFTGKFADGQMELRTRAVERNDKIFISRMVFKNITADSFDWDWQRSADNGETWQDVWNIHYERKKKS